MTVIFSMLGGLALFLYGMRVMSDSIEKVAGAKLRHVLEIFTTNRFSGMLVGIIFTVAMQSSSACTVMVVSFVNAGLMNLFQGASVIFGANIGTTVTTQLVSFNFSQFAPVIFFVGVLVTLFIKKEKIRQIGEIILGFGVLFYGMSTMSAAMSSLKTDPRVVEILAGLTSPLLALIAGVALTAIVQSSAVIVSIVILLAQQDLIALPIGIYVVLGTSVGTCVTALLGSLSGKKRAKQAAMIHLWFNVIGAAVCYVILIFAMDPVVHFLQMISGNNGRFIANTHLLIKLFQVAVLLPFVKQIVWLAERTVPGEDKKIAYKASFQLKYIGKTVVFNPATAVVGVIKEMERMAFLASENLNRAMNALVTLDEEDIEEVYAVEENINYLNHAITDYLVKINQSTLPIEDMQQLGALFHVVNDIERIGDHAENAADAAKQRQKTGANLSKVALKELGEMMDMVNEIIRFSIDIFAKSDMTHVQDVNQLEDRIDKKERELQAHHIDRLARGECTPEAGMIFSDIVSGLERVADHATNIAFAIRDAEENEA